MNRQPVSRAGRQRMLAIPAIDLCQGICVRLEQGDFERRTDYSSDPQQIARQFAAAGAQRIHVVDLDAAKSGRPQNRAAIARIAAAAADAGASIQLGGGMRSRETIAAAIDDGAAQVIVGSAAIADFEFFRDCCEQFPGRILLGLDARAGKLATEGWRQSSDADLDELAGRADAAGAAGIIRDGMLTGANLQATAQIAAAVSCPVFASGGFAQADELEELAARQIAGVIIGRAIYEGKVDFAALASRARMIR